MANACARIQLVGMKQYRSLFRASVIALAIVEIAACVVVDGQPDPAGTPELRGALVDTIVARTERREAFSPIKNERLGFEPLAALRALRDEVVTAETEEALFHALARLSHARRDRHLDLFLVPGGLALSATARGWTCPAHRMRRPLGRRPSAFSPTTPTAPVLPTVPPRLQVAPTLATHFVGDLGPDARWSELPSIGDRDRERERDAGHGLARLGDRVHATFDPGRAAVEAGRGDDHCPPAAFPAHLRGDALTLGVRTAAGDETSYRLPFVAPGELAWSGTGEPGYPGLALALRTPTYDLLLPEDGRPEDGRPGTGAPS